MKKEENFKLEIKPFVKKDRQKYKIIKVTDIQYHSTNKRPTKKIGNVASKNQDSLTPYRAYTDMKDWNVPREQQKAMIIEMLHNDKSYVDFVIEQEKLGYKILLEIPEEIPVTLGDDTEEFLKSKKGKRIVRWISKNK